MEKYFFDSNIVCYAFGKGEEKKRNAARKLIFDFAGEKKVQISTQVLQEFANVAKKKFDYSKKIICGVVDFLEENFFVHTNGTGTIKLALEISEKSQLSFWDALIVSAASESGCSVLYTEDLNAGQIIEGVRIENPLL